MSRRLSTLLTLIVATTALTACGDEAYPIRTGNDYAVTNGGLGSMAGGAVGTAPEQQRNWDPQPAEQPPGPAVMPPQDTPTTSVTTPAPDAAYAPPPAADMPVAEAPQQTTAPSMPQTAPAPTYSNADANAGTASAPSCNYADMIGKPLAEESVTKLVRLGKIVRELAPDGAATMDFQENRVNITTDPNTGKVTAVTCG